MIPAPHDIPINPPLEFPLGSRVVDIGCGDGRLLRQIATTGTQVIGVEIDPTNVRICLEAGYDVRQGVAEKLPLADTSCDGILCNVVLPYNTVEHLAIAEWARVLAPGGIVRATYHGLGYAINQVLRGPRVKVRVYGARTVANGCWYAVTNRRLPGWLGDTVYQSRRRLNKYYTANHLELVTEVVNGQRFGHPVFLYHELRKAAT